MTSLSKIVAEEVRGSLPRENLGLPSLDLMDMQGVEIPLEYDITAVLGDILMCEVADENIKGEVKRNGIIISQAMATKMWRVAKIILRGPQCSENVKVGDYVMYPSDKGIPLISHEGKKLIFLNESRMFCICKPREVLNIIEKVEEPVNQIKTKNYEEIPPAKVTTVCCAGCGGMFNKNETITSGGLSWCKECKGNKIPDTKTRGLIKIK